MTLTNGFLEVAERLLDPGMGTENVGFMLYSLVRMRRPETVLAVGLGYSTLFLLQALSDNLVEAKRDSRIRDGRLKDDGRKEVLRQDDGYPPETSVHLHGIDDFSADDGRLSTLLKYIEQQGLSSLFTLYRCRYQEAELPPDAAPYGFIWIDCAHQLDYSDLLNRYWPLLDSDGGLLALHYTYIDINVATASGDQAVVVAGPLVNTIKQQLLTAGMAANFELLSLVEPHKLRQGSLTILRKLDESELCRPALLAQEQQFLYGDQGTPLNNLNQR